MKIPFYLVGSVSAYSGVMLIEDTPEDIIVHTETYVTKIRKSFSAFARLCDAASYTILGTVFHNMALNWTVTQEAVGFYPGRSD